MTNNKLHVIWGALPSEEGEYYQQVYLTCTPTIAISLDSDVEDFPGGPYAIPPKGTYNNGGLIMPSEEDEVECIEGWLQAWSISEDTLTWLPAPDLSALQAQEAEAKAVKTTKAIKAIAVLQQSCLDSFGVLSQREQMIKDCIALSCIPVDADFEKRYGYRIEGHEHSIGLLFTPTGEKRVDSYTVTSEGDGMRSGGSTHEESDTYYVYAAENGDTYLSTSYKKAGIVFFPSKDTYLRQRAEEWVSHHIFYMEGELYKRTHATVQDYLTSKAAIKAAEAQALEEATAIRNVLCAFTTALKEQGVECDVKLPCGTRVRLQAKDRQVSCTYGPDSWIADTLLVTLETTSRLDGKYSRKELYRGIDTEAALIAFNNGQALAKKESPCLNTGKPKPKKK